MRGGEAPGRADRLIGTGDAPALLERDRTLTHAELNALVDRVAGGIAARAAPGERVAIWAPKSIEMVAALFAAMRAGCVAVPVNPALRGPQVEHILDDSGAALLITHRARAAGLDRPALTLEDDWDALHGPPPADAPGGDTLAALLYTSGSTGRAKGVMVSHANLIAGAESVASYLSTTPDDRTLAALPLSFDFGLSQLTTAWSRGASAALLDYLAPRDVVRAVERFGCTQLGAVPPLWVQLVEQAWGPTRLRTLSNTGGRLPVPVVRRLREMFPAARLHLMFGLTEAFRATTLPPELADAHPDSIGRAIPGAEVLVCRPDGSLAADDEPGELVQMGPHVAQGYWRDAERTAERFRPAPAASRLGGRAVWSGDTVRRDVEGLLYFVGRSDETIKTMGTRVSPTEVEEVAHASGAVTACAAFGEADARAGQRVLLVASPRGPDAAARLAAHFRTAAPGYMAPARVVWLDALPLSANGKIDRAALRLAHVI